MVKNITNQLHSAFFKIKNLDKCLVFIVLLCLMLKPEECRKPERYY